MNYTWLTFLAISSASLFFPYAKAENISKHLTTVVQPEPIKRVPPKYPINAAKNNREGWAKASFIIEKDGSVSNILVNETSGSSEFAKASKRAIAQWKYKPAFENGEPIQQCVNSVKIDFRMSSKGEGGEKGVRRAFLLKYKKARKSLEAKAYDDVKLVLTEMDALKRRHLSENNYLHLLWADYQKAIGDKEKELFHLYRIAVNVLSDKLKLSVLHSIFQLELAKNRLRYANSTYLKLSKLSIAEPYMASYKELISNVDDFISGDQNIIITANIEDKDYWSYQLVRNEFSLVNVEGKLNKLDVRCANKRHVYTVEENNTWKIPNTWKSCNIYVYGENNAKFNLVEHPFENKA